MIIYHTCSSTGQVSQGVYPSLWADRTAMSLLLQALWTMGHHPIMGPGMSYTIQGNVSHLISRHTRTSMMPPYSASPEEASWLSRSRMWRRPRGSASTWRGAAPPACWPGRVAATSGPQSLVRRQGYLAILWTLRLDLCVNKNKVFLK